MAGTKEKMKKGSILKNVALLGGAKSISYGLVLAASPLLTRLFSPEDFGTFAVFGAILGILGNAICLKYEFAIPLARDEAEAANIFVLCGAILGFFVFVFSLVVFVLQVDIAGWLESPGLRPYFWLLPLGVLGVGVAQLGQLWAARNKRFKRIATAGMASSAIVLISQISLGVLRFGPGGLIYGRLAGMACSILVLLYPALRDVRALLHTVTRASLIEVAKKHRKFLFYLTPSSGINTIGRQLPVLILSIYFGPAVTGLYALTQRVVSVPMTLIGEEVRRVCYPYAADMERAEDLRNLIRSVFSSLVRIALPGALIVGLVAPELFSLVFGQRWTDSGIYAQWLCPWLFIHFICSPLTRLPLILKRQEGELVFQIVLTGLRAAALIAGGIAQDVALTIGLFAGVSLVCWIGFLIWSMKLIGVGMYEVFGVLARELFVVAPIVAPLVLAKFVLLGVGDDLWLLAVGTACALVALAVVILRSGHLSSFLPGPRES
jgi:O-antigen/teichoic acid export membrane protein